MFGKILKFLSALFAIVLGLFVIIKLVGNVELIVGIISLTFGILAIIWTLKARSVLSAGSSLRKYTGNFLMCLIFILLFSVWNTMSKILSFQGIFLYFEYFFIIMAYMVFVMAAYQILYLGKEFGFSKEIKIMKKAIKEKKSKTK